MRWPNRHPHSLTAGMRKAQQGLARFLPLISWQHFRRKNLNNEIVLSAKGLAGFCCGDPEQAVLWLLRTGNLNKKGMQNRQDEVPPSYAKIPGLRPGTYAITAWDTEAGVPVDVFELDHGNDSFLQVPVQPISGNLAFAIKRIGHAKGETGRLR
jgi:hypothetical protein